MTAPTAMDLARGLTAILKDLVRLERLTGGFCRTSRAAVATIAQDVLSHLPTGGAYAALAEALAVAHDHLKLREEPGALPTVWLARIHSERTSTVLTAAFTSERAAHQWARKNAPTLTALGHNPHVEPLLVRVHPEEKES